MKHRHVTIFLCLFLVVALLFASCGDDDDDDDNDGIDDDNVDDDATDDDATDDDLDDDDDDTPAPHAPRFVRPQLPLNPHYVAASHNSYIWRGLQGILSQVGSLGLTDSLDKSQVFLEIDVNDVGDDGDFWVHHNDSTGRVRLSSLLRNLRWWSDTHPDHQPIVLGFEWNVGTGTEEMDDLRALFAEFLVAPSPLTETGPLYAMRDWLDELLLNLDSATREEIDALTPRELARVVGYPTPAQMRGRVLLEVSSEMYAALPAFFLMGGDGQIDNNSESSLEDLTLISANRAEQRLTRVYPKGERIFSLNYDLFTGLRNGVSNSAMNMQWTSVADKAVYAFLDENAPGFAPVGEMLTDDGVPARLGPPVFATAFAATAPAQASLTVTFDDSRGLPDAPLAIFQVIVVGLRGGEVTSISAPLATALSERHDDGLSAVFGLSPQAATIEVAVEVAGDEEGYELFVVGPTVADMTIVAPSSDAGGAIWLSPSFTAIDLTPTGACTTLGPFGERLYGNVVEGECDAADNPSFLREMNF